VIDEDEVVKKPTANGKADLRTLWYFASLREPPFRNSIFYFLQRRKVPQSTLMVLNVSALTPRLARR
jgi:hypothetical protein